ncbi:MAG: guanosine-3',5'-bis(diphosphate) 3'-pyrophosphohydrolase, partial [Yoonia sp.]
ELLAQLGSAEITGRSVVTAIYPELESQQGDEIEQARAVVGLNPDQVQQRGACCQPVPGERILGITFRGLGVIVHAIDCEALADYEEQPERWIDLHWQEGNHSAVNTVTFDVTIANASGVLGRICTLIGEQNANISDLRFIDRKPDYFRLLIDVDLRDAEHLHRVRTALEAESNVSSIVRHKDPGLAVPGAGTSRREG